ncbi:TPA: hypothetical protein ACGD2I_003773 [Aeromonas hydrophila]|uniref:hypothetical protein n=1 Tax=Aeromonas hydrophila TaxID=644 RepID=UPI000FD178AA|nr:hypothetical protein [Aeromonas hydrophila]AZU49641.1 hypothetical protein C3B79_3924 [Aeromonas hydrophila]MCV3294771.1 hypothetical protein [Aeromonas hydrophila]QBX70048.1 hypothetical protein E4625_03750 [Aeromonas hydrophila]QBX74779.1 hypothetical protein E4630_03750 [Aeromonas hydrophila]WDA25176.1 hypothetical protein PSC74_01895 [Aeromonas hydrophila]
MDEKVKASWERVLHPDTLKTNIITASIFSMAFEMLKSSIIEKIEGFFTNGFDENGMIVGPGYKEKVLALNRSPLYASLKWLQDMTAIDDKDLESFEHIKRCRNTLAHEMLTFASTGVDFDVADAFEEMIRLLRKIEIWWFENLEMAIDPDAYPKDLDLDQVISGTVWSLQMLIDVALGPEEEARKYYEHFVANADKT